MPRHLPATVVVTGSECTGKSTLAGQLAAHFHAPVSREFVREYLDGKGGELDATDVEPIARGQIALEDAAGRAATALVVKDTDLLSTVTYARHYYGACPQWIVDAARARRADLYLLLAPDVPWVADGQRDRPAARTEMDRLFRRTLDEFGAAIIEISGSWPVRWRAAQGAVARLLRDVAPAPRRRTIG